MQVLFLSALGMLLALGLLVRPAKSMVVVIYVGAETGSETRPFNTIQEAHHASTNTVPAGVYGSSDQTQVPFIAPPCGAGLIDWTEYPANPVYDPAQKAYYPSVIYEANAFGHSLGNVISDTLPYTYTVSPYYKMWVAKSNTGDGIRFTYSDDGLTWYEFNGGMLLPGLTSDGYHSRVLYDAGGFGGSGVYYKIWYWDPPTIYEISAIRYAESVNGIQWTNDQTITQSTTMPLVTGIASSGWQRGTYGPIQILYQAGASNTGSDPFNYSYVMYYDATDGGQEVTGLAYSADGIMWTRYGSGPVLDASSAGAWDSNDVAFGTILQDDIGNFHFWYSGGSGPVHEGIGYATSTDGVNWVKSIDNPIFHIDDGVSWRTNRTYTPIVLYSPTRFDGHGSPEQYKMWFTGDNGNRAIGYATINPVHLSLTSGSGQSGLVNSALSQPFVVELRDNCNNLASDISVTFAISDTPVGAGGQSLSVVSGTTDGSGRISTTLTGGDKVGEYTVMALATGIISLPTTFSATIEATAPPAGGDIFLPIVFKK